MEEDRRFIGRLEEEFRCTETLSVTLKQCVRYAGLAGIRIDEITEKMREENRLPVTNKKDGIKQLSFLRDRLTDCENADFTCVERSRPSAEKPKTLYIESGIADHPNTIKIRKQFPELTPVEIGNYKDVFYHPEDRKRGIILAEKSGKSILPGAPVCQDFDEKYFYYVSCVTGCPYDCEYCYLKGMHPSRDIVIYVNQEALFAEAEELLRGHEAYICISYDSDLMALENATGFVHMWSEFVRAHAGLLVECRTKSAGINRWSRLDPCDRMIYAFTLSPEEVIRSCEHGAPSLPARLASAKTAMEHGFTVRLCFDPVILIPGWRNCYGEMMKTVLGTIDINRVRDISIGSFRISGNYLRRLRQCEPDSAAVQYPFVQENGVYQYPADHAEEASAFLKSFLSDFSVNIFET